MALYDDDDDDGPSQSAHVQSKHKDKEEPQAESKPDGAKDITMKFLQTHMAQKRNASSFTPQRAIVTPVIDLSSRNRSMAPLNMRKVQPVRAMPLSESSPLSFLPKSATDDSVLLFGEVVVKNEYQPALPNDYLVHKKKKEEREAKEKAAKEIADRLAREHKEEAKKREKGAAIAPPTFLDDPPPPVKDDKEKSTFTSPSVLPVFGKSTTRGLGVAANIMSKYGYKQGSGLGKDEQGMSTALSVDRTGRNTGVIINESKNEAGESQFAAPSLANRPSNQAAVMNSSSKVLLLTNVVSPDEVDDELKDEITEEMGKYGQVNNVVVHKVDNADEAEAVRIFVEFTNVAQAIKAYIVMNGRFFGGRQVVARFYSFDEYTSGNYTV